MAFFEQKELKNLYKTARDEALQWRKDYPEYERLADNGLIDDLDDSLPEINDGSLAAALFKLPKRIINSELTGKFKAEDTDEAWVTELANIYWDQKIVPNANYKAPFHRKWKDIVRKASIYGSQPIISLLVDDGKGGTKADIDVPYAQDVVLEPGKVSDLDSDIIFWDVYYSNKQVRDLIEQAEKAPKTDTADKWYIKELKAVVKSNQDNEDRNSNEDHSSKKDKSVTKGGIKFCIAFQRGIKAPFYMYHYATDKVVREWENPDPTGDIPVKFVYCYQDFNNPYGIGIVKLAGGTQNVLDELRRLHVLATQIGVRPPLKISGNEDEVDEDSLIYAQEQPWYVGSANVEQVNMANGVYQQMSNTVSMYKTSLNQIIPTGDTSISSVSSGDPQYSKTPAGVKFQANQLSVDDEDFKDNTFMTYEAVAKNLINLTFANMQGSDLLKLSDEDREKLSKAGLDFPVDEEGNATNELEIIWDEARATFNFELDAEDDQKGADQQLREDLMQAIELRNADPNFDISMQQSGYRFNLGEAYYTLMKLITKNDKIVEEISPEDQELMEEQVMAQEDTQAIDDEQARVNVEAVMQEHGVDSSTAAEMLMLEEEGYSPEAIQQALANKREMEMMR